MTCLNSLLAAAMLVTTADTAHAGMIHSVEEPTVSLATSTLQDCSKIEDEALRRRCQQQQGMALTAGPKALTDAEIWPEDFRIAFDGQGNLYLGTGNTVSLFRADGAIATMADSAAWYASADVWPDATWQSDEGVVDVQSGYDGIGVLLADGTTLFLTAEGEVFDGDFGGGHDIAFTDLDADGIDDVVVLSPSGEAQVFTSGGSFGVVYDTYLAADGGGGSLALTRAEGGFDLYVP